MTEGPQKNAQPPPLAPASAAATPDEPKIASRFDDDMSYKELRRLRKARGYEKRDAKSLLEIRLLAMRRARGYPDARSSASKKWPLMATLRSAFAEG